MGEPTDLDPLTARAVAEYIHQMSGDLSRMAKQAGFRAAAEALEVARLVLEEALQEKAAPGDAA